MTAFDVVKVGFDVFKSVFVWFAACTYFLTLYVEKLSPEKKEAFKVNHALLWSFVVTLAGFGADAKKIRAGVLGMARATKSKNVETIVEAVAPEDDGDEITLKEPPPRVPIAPPKTLAPPPVPEIIYRRPRVEGRHSHAEIDLPPEATETIEPRKKLC